jgi:hypothetical protein
VARSPDPARYVGVVAFTYGGQAAFGVTTDLASVPEANDIAQAISDEITALHLAAGPKRRRVVLPS